ncbi:MAG: bifunctional UDP-N-acetylglucosamine diphosphorylase/glucosamine-1-phosphate N-acetyltransferase GlmU [Gammaproteobacteria bacterium]|jgi:bifunctional UDP-N-acetylglucosamine pyrophosphorylase/glucosamine-1-phosphate N-acetyltransferase
MFTSIILGAGKSTRMKANKSKLLFNIAGKPVINHIISSLKTAKAKSNLCVINNNSPELKKLLDEEKVDYTYQSVLDGTAGAVKSALKKKHPFSSKILILCGDVPFITSASIKKLITKLKTADAVVGTIELDSPKGYGRIVRINNRFDCIVEDKETTAEQRLIREVNTGIIAIHEKILRKYIGQIKNNNQKKEYYLTDIIKILTANNKKVSTFKFKNELEVKGVNSKVDLVNLERQYLREKAEELLESGTLIRDPSKTDIRGQLRVSSNVEIDINCVFEDSVSIGENSTIGHNCYLNRCKIGRNVFIKPNTIIFGATIGDNSTVGPFARIRPGTTIKSYCNIGNFVEIKNSLIKENTKINHLSYVGDATIGKNVNIGAGAITCNYDGVNKHKTIVKDNSFIGSGSMLVAPVIIGKGSFIAAGSTITKDTSGSGHLTIARSKQMTIRNWKNRTTQKVKRK